MGFCQCAEVGANEGCLRKALARPTTTRYIGSGLPQGPVWRTICFRLHSGFKMGFCQWPGIGSKSGQKVGSFGCKSG